LRDWADVLETAMMWSGAFPEPLTFSIRALRALRLRPHAFDVVHDNQGLGYGMLGVKRLGLPVVTSIHHPISVDRRIDLAALNWRQALSRRRWYGFVRMQARVARALESPVITVSQAAKADICKDFRLNSAMVNVVPLGVDTRLFHPRARARVPGRIVTVASADSPLKGLPALLQAFAKVVTDRDARLIIVGKPAEQTRRLEAELGLSGRVTFTHGLGDSEYADLLASAEVAVVPSIYEGFSLPAVEHMASGTPLIVSRAGALPEVTGDAALAIRPGDAEELAAALRLLLDSPSQRDQLAGEALARVGERFAWPAVAAATVAHYRAAIAANSTPRMPTPC
jgi:glycosyltransferase involved in cell wall biosynthesis